MLPSAAVSSNWIAVPKIATKSWKVCKKSQLGVPSQRRKWKKIYQLSQQFRSSKASRHWYLQIAEGSSNLSLPSLPDLCIRDQFKAEEQEEVPQKLREKTQSLFISSGWTPATEYSLAIWLPVPKPGTLSPLHANLVSTRGNVRHEEAT